MSNLKFSSILLPIAVFLISASAAASNADWIEGIVTIEKRATIVASDPGCTECQKSKPFWALVVRQPKKTFELNEMFFLGNEDAPPAVELAGISIQPGAEIQLRAEVAADYGQYAFVGKVEQVRVVREVTIPETPVWTCRSRNGSDVDLIVEIYDKARDSRARQFEMRVFTLSAEGLRQIDRFRDVRTAISLERGFFAGQNRLSQVELSMDFVMAFLSSIPGEIRYTRSFGGPGNKKPVQVIEQLECTHSTR
jgi:hypothetical protein